MAGGIEGILVVICKNNYEKQFKFNLHKILN